MHLIRGPCPSGNGVKNPLSVSERFNCETFEVFCTLNHQAAVVATGMQQRIRRGATVGSRRTSHRLHSRKLLDLHTGTSNTLSMSCNWRESMVRSLDHGDSPLRHDKDNELNDLCNRETITASSNWGISWSDNSLDREKQPLRNDRMNCTTCATSITMSSNWGNTLVQKRSGPWKTASAPRQKRPVH